MKQKIFSFGVAVGLLLASATGCQDAGSVSAQPPTEQPTRSQKVPEPDVQPESTEHTAEPKRVENRLAKETSPYLLLHAHNPVDWYPWGEEALERARQENKLIFLSIGYSSCHWCHVMERESFMDPEIADYMNEHFVCIKVDREERPDVDHVYMTSLQIYYQLNGVPQAGGWPLSMFLTPAAEPFFGGTYFPPRAARGRPGFLDILQHIARLWEQEPERILKTGAALTGVVSQSLEAVPEEATSQFAVNPTETLNSLFEQFDPEHGGFGYNASDSRRPKFPEPSNLAFLLDYHRRNKDEKSREMFLKTLEEMAAGGIHDHIGGGFHRYSTDRYWLVPHFEKMLYDNGQLATAYAEAYVLTENEEFKLVAEALLEFVARELRDEQGGFFSALDAESEGVEGRFYVWTEEQLKQTLDEEAFARFQKVYTVNGQPNFEGEYFIPAPQESRQVLAEEHGESLADLEARLSPLRQRLLQVRAERSRPLMDTKILTAWNGLMIRGFADAGRILENDEYVQYAEEAASFVAENLLTEQGRLFRTFAGGSAKLNAYLDDYAFLIDGLIALHQATADPRWLELAGKLMEVQIEQFWDEQRGGFFFTSHDHEKLIARGKNAVDSALPSGNSISVLNLIYLARHLDRPEYLARAEEAIQAFAPRFPDMPGAMPRLAMAQAALEEARSSKSVSE